MLRTTTFALLLFALTFAGAPAASAAGRGCRGNPGPDCLYTPPQLYPQIIETPAAITYTDFAGAPRVVPIEIRRPVGAAGPLPVLILSHGGGARMDPDPTHVLDELGKAAAHAGYIAISAVHLQVTAQTRTLRCPLFATPVLDPDDCAGLDMNRLDRPRDISAIIDELERGAQLPDLAALADTARIAVAGHSNGSSGALQVAGLIRAMNDSSHQLFQTRDERPVAFVALSPMGANEFGIFDTGFQGSIPRALHSWVDIERPVLFATGDGDSSCREDRLVCGNGDTPMNRRSAFYRVPAGGNKYQLYIKDAITYHTLMGLDMDACPAAETARCNEIRSWITSSVFAFLDAHVKGLQGAALWLRSGNIERASGGDVEWSMK
ncbi:MAG: hypothetical protein KDC27_20360 [Acidobacteria bacterium]|nr:hypothetical protein [Acidobacteriota bacterium]